MNVAKLAALLADHRRLAEAMADPAVLPSLPPTPETIRALPIQLAPFQARWLLGNCTDEILKCFREMHPVIVVQQFGRGAGTRYRYSKIEICKVGHVPYADFTAATPKKP
jgi:hypothetical protein